MLNLIEYCFHTFLYLKLNTRVISLWNNNLNLEKVFREHISRNSCFLYKVNLNILSKELWKTYYSPYWFKLYTEELNTLTYNINKGLVDNPKIVEQREEYKIKDRELKIWQEPGFAVLIAITLILGGYLIGAFLWD